MVIAMPFLPSLPENATFLDLDKEYGDLLRPVGPFAHGLMRGPSPLSPGERELIAAYVSGLNRCRVCFESHVEVARSFGIDEPTLRSLVDDVDAAPVDARLKPLLRYVRKLTETPSRLIRADAEAVLAAGWSERALFHAIAVCGLSNYMNRIADGVGIDTTPEFYAGMAWNPVRDRYDYRGRRLFRLIARLVATFDSMIARLRSWVRVF